MVSGDDQGQKAWERTRLALGRFRQFHRKLDEPGTILVNSTLALSAVFLLLLFYLRGFAAALIPLLVLAGVFFYGYRQGGKLEASSGGTSDNLESAPSKTNETTEAEVNSAEAAEQKSSTSV